MKKVGTLEVNSKLFIGDPCYSTDLLGSADLEHGTYSCYVEKSRKLDRIKNISILDSSYNTLDVYICSTPICECGVDSGQLGFFNSDKYRKKVSKEVYDKLTSVKFPYEEWKKEYRESDTERYSFYRACCNATLCEKQYGIIDNVGFVSSSGYGDGVYPCFPMLNIGTNKMVGLHVEFM